MLICQIKYVQTNYERNSEKKYINIFEKEQIARVFKPVHVSKAVCEKAITGAKRTENMRKELSFIGKMLC